MSRFLIPVIVFFSLLLSLPPAQAQRPPRVGLKEVVLKEEVLAGKIDVDFSSQYIWRGLELNRQAVLQPAIRMSDKGLEVEVQGNMDLTSSNENRGKFTRWIYRGGLARRDREGEVAFSYIYYDNREIGYPKTQEIALETRWGYPMFAGGNVYWDFDNADGFYFNSSIGYIGDIGPLRIVPKLAIGYATSHYQEHYFGVHESSFLDVEASFKLELNIVGGIFIVAEGKYYELAKSGLRHKEEQIRQGENFWARGSLSLRF